MCDELPMPKHLAKNDVIVIPRKFTPFPPPKIKDFIAENIIPKVINFKDAPHFKPNLTPE